jgi:predicted metal-binding membrane protein
MVVLFTSVWLRAAARPAAGWDGPASVRVAMDLSAALFLALWAAMMVAIAFPTAAPTSDGRGVSRSRERGERA